MLGKRDTDDKLTEYARYYFFSVLHMDESISFSQLYEIGIEFAHFTDEETEPERS